MTPLEAMTRLVDALTEPVINTAGVISWAGPVPFFGRINESQVATVGINPSNLEFVDGRGNPLAHNERRLPTLGSMGLERWSSADLATSDRLLLGCSSYFDNNPYRAWFDALDRMLAPSGHSYYANMLNFAAACHLDVVPYATYMKWGALTSAQRGALLAMGLDATAHFLRTSPVRLLILNGSSVVNLLRPHVADLETTAMPAWNLPRKTAEIPGSAYMGETRHFAGVDLGRTVRLLGWNHNIQSSYGVTTGVRTAIAHWIASEGNR